MFVEYDGTFGLNEDPIKKLCRFYGVINFRRTTKTLREGSSGGPGTRSSNLEEVLK